MYIHGKKKRFSRRGKGSPTLFMTYLAKTIAHSNLQLVFQLSLHIWRKSVILSIHFFNKFSLKNVATSQVETPDERWTMADDKSLSDI